MAKKKEFNVAEIRLARAVRVGPMSQTEFKVLTKYEDLLFVEPRSDIVPKYNVRSANGVAEVLHEKLLGILLSNFGDHERKFPEGMVFEYDKKHPLALVPIVYQAVKEISRCLKNAGESYTEPKEEEEEVPSEEPSAEKDLGKSIDFRILDDEKLRDRIMYMLRKYSDIWSEYLVKVDTAEHWIEPKPDTKPSNQVTYLQGLTIRKKAAESVKDQLEKVCD